jgi:hypothetical protein
LYEADQALPTMEKFAAIVDTLGLTAGEITVLVRLVERRKGSDLNERDRSTIPTAETTSEAGVAQPPTAAPADI